MRNLIKNIENWHKENKNFNENIEVAMNIFNKSGLLSLYVSNNYKDGIERSVGDIFILLVIMCHNAKKPMNWSRYESAGAEWQDTQKELALEAVCSISDFVSDLINEQTVCEESLCRVIGNMTFIAENELLNFEECVRGSYKRFLEDEK